MSPIIRRNLRCHLLHVSYLQYNTVQCESILMLNSVIIATDIVAHYYLSRSVLLYECYRYFATTIKERLTQGGASGAFFFFSKGEKFIAKSCSSSELDTLKHNAEAYANYMEVNKDSYIVASTVPIACRSTAMRCTSL